MGNAFIKFALESCEELVAEASNIFPPAEKDALDAFAAQLAGLGGLDFATLRARVGHLPLPGEFAHMRLTNLNTGLSWGGSYSMDHEPLRTEDLLLHMVCCNNDNATETGSGIWVETVVLGYDTPGLLELGVRFLRLN